MTHTAAEDAQVHYRDRTTFLDDHARNLPASLPLTKGIIRHYAAIAYRAARAEQVDPDPPAVRSCDLCHGVRVCDVDAHRALGWSR